MHLPREDLSSFLPHGQPSPPPPLSENAQGAAGADNTVSVDTAKDTKADNQSVIDIEPKPEITYDDFSKLQFQVGEIIACEEVKKSKKLLCSQVKIGSQVKQIVSGIKAHYSAQEMVGKKVMVLVNLKPATLAGVVSEGMLLCFACTSFMSRRANRISGASVTFVPDT